jgi:hypothetical protein
MGDSESSPQEIPSVHDGGTSASLGSPRLADLVERIPEGWTRASYRGRAYGLSRTTRVGGRSISVTAAELGGQDLISANVYRTRRDDVLRSCEMPDAKVLAFLREWTPA